MRSWDRGRSGGPGAVRGAGGGPGDGVAGKSGGPGSGGLNSRIVTIIFETENLFFSAREGYSAIHYGIRRRGERGLRFPPSPLRPSPCRGCCVGLKSVCGPFWAAGWVRPALAGFQFVPAQRRLPRRLAPGLWRVAANWIIPVSARGRIRPGHGRRPPVPREPDSGGGHVHAEALPPVPAAAPLCRPCPQVPASLHAPASCSAWRPCAGRGSGTPWSIPGTAGRCPRRGPGRRALPCGRPLFPGPWSCRGRSCPRNGADGADRGPFRTRARRWRCGQPGREPSIPPPWETATGVLPSPTPPERRWRPGPKAEVNGGNAGRRRLASQHAGRHRALRTFRPAETPPRPQGSRPGPPTVSGVMVSPEGSCGGGRGGPRQGVSACRIPKALSSPVVCHL